MPRRRIERATAAWLERHAVVTAIGVMLAIALVLAAAKGVHDLGQTTVNGLTTGSYLALGAVGVTLVYGSLRLINFAHGDFLTLGAYVALVFNVTLGTSLIIATLIAVVAVAAFGVTTELVLWKPLRARGAGRFQLILVAIGVAFVLRYGIEFVAGSGFQQLHVNVTDSYFFLGGLSIGKTELVVDVVAFVVILFVGLVLRYSNLGKQMRAISDDLQLAETTGLNTSRIIGAIWAFAGGLAGVAGVLYAASIGSFDPQFGFVLMLGLFAAVILGGFGSAYGALVGGLMLGLMQEWSTLLFAARWKVLVGFVVLLVVVIIRPQGIFGRARTL